MVLPPESLTSTHKQRPSSATRLDSARLDRRLISCMPAYAKKQTALCVYGCISRSRRSSHSFRCLVIDGQLTFPI